MKFTWTGEILVDGKPCSPYELYGLLNEMEDRYDALEVEVDRWYDENLELHRLLNETEVRCGALECEITRQLAINRRLLGQNRDWSNRLAELEAKIWADPEARAKRFKS